MTFDPEKIVAKLAALGHRYELAPKLSMAELAEVEEQFGVKLPDDYRTFLLEVGSGGAGPGYGLFPLGREGGTWGWDGDGAILTGDLRKPFPHTKEWNVSFEELAEGEDEDAYWARRDAWDDEVYWNPKETTGAICICHEGCAIRDWLVVTGAERGRIWLDDRASNAGLIPRGKTFAEWYLAWLDEAS